MEAKQKARELIDKFSNECLLTRSGGKISALIAVNEILNSNPHSNSLNTNVESTMQYWQEVKTYISYE
jgi:hypothetical protein